MPGIYPSTERKNLNFNHCVGGEGYFPSTFKSNAKKDANIVNYHQINL